MVAACPDDEFIALFEKHGPAGTAKHLGISIRNVLARRRNLESKLKRDIISPIGPGSVRQSPVDRGRRLLYPLKDGVILVGSDAHYWPGYVPTAHRGLLHLAELLAPKAIILNGDVVDGARLSRHNRIAWAQTPNYKEELEVCCERLDEIRSAAGEQCDFLWTWGNHDQRFDTYLSNRADAVEGIKGMALADHFPHWRFFMSIWVNNSLVVKHRFKGGDHAAWNNTIKSGKSMLTGHLHSLKVTPFTDYNGTRFGIDSGTMNAPDGEHADYSEDNPHNHRAGLIVLTFRNGVLMWPEIAHVIDDHHIDFRGKLIKV